MSPLSPFAWGCATALGLILLGLALILLRNPILIRIGVRNIPRRPAQSLFIMLGLTLSTTLFVTALSLGDTLRHSMHRQVVNAYGLIDQVITPAFLAELLDIARGGTSGEERSETGAYVEDLIAGLAAGESQALLRLLQDGLPGIPEERYWRLRSQVAGEPLVDGVAGTILMPTVLRNRRSGQGEPLAVVFAVDGNYEQEFGLHDATDGSQREIGALAAGSGSSLAALRLAFLGVRDALETAATPVEPPLAEGRPPEPTREAVLSIAALLVLLSDSFGQTTTLDNVSIEVHTLSEWGMDNRLLEEAGLETLSLQTMGMEEGELTALGLDPHIPLHIPSLRTLGVDLPDLRSPFSEFMLQAFSQQGEDNASLGSFDLDPGEVYVSELGALQLDARPGDTLEVFVGPVPLPYRVRAVVQESGPLGPVLPVVMMALEEAQGLFLMPNRVNAILISNAGDARTGLRHTADVKRLLQGLAIDDARLAAVKAVLSRPAVSGLILAQAPAAVVPSSLTEDIPETMATLWGDIAAALAGTEGFQENIDLLASHVSSLPMGNGTETDWVLRQVLANAGIRAWLLDLALTEADHQDLRLAFRDLEDFQVLTPLSKNLALEGVDAAGVAFSTLFSVAGAFSVMAGILLIFLIFVMLAAERRRELGIARAVGMQRGHVMQMFITEGMLYDLAASLLGLGLGVLASYSMLGFMTGFFSEIGQQTGVYEELFGLQWSVAPVSLVLAYSLGVLVTGCVTMVASWRVSRTNLIAAMRDLPDTVKAMEIGMLVRWGQFLLGVLVLGASLFHLPTQLMGSQRAFVLLEASLALVGFMYLVQWGLGFTAVAQRTSRQSTATLLGLGLLAIWVLPWQTDGNRIVWTALGQPNAGLWGETPEEVLLVMVLTGPIVLLGGTFAYMGCAGILARGFARLGMGLRSVAPAVNLAVSYALNQRFRIGVTMLLIAMVITSVTVMTLVIETAESLARMPEEETGGFDLVLEPGLLGAFFPIADLAEAAQELDDFPWTDIAAIGSVARLDTYGRQIAPIQKPNSASLELTGINAGFATQVSGIYGFRQRAAGYETDGSIWQALATRDDVAVVQGWVLGGQVVAGDTTGSLSLNPPVRYVLEHITDTEQRTISVQVIGELESDTVADGGFLVNRQVLKHLSGDLVAADVHYVQVATTADKRATATALERALLSSGLNVVVFEERFLAGQAVVNNVLKLFRGFLALGLIVGMAGLAVIGIRAVAERRQQIGVLRALGCPSGLVSVVFILETTFIAWGGILLGGATGLFVGSTMTVRILAESFEQGLTVPWTAIAGILLLAYVLSLLVAILSVWQASRILPAEALRYE